MPFGITISPIPIAMTTTTGYDAYMADGQVAFVTVESFSLVQSTITALMPILMSLHIPEGRGGAKPRA
jgi:hypothetical protein